MATEHTATKMVKVAELISLSGVYETVQNTIKGWRLQGMDSLSQRGASEFEKSAWLINFDAKITIEEFYGAVSTVIAREYCQRFTEPEIDRLLELHQDPLLRRFNHYSVALQPIVGEEMNEFVRRVVDLGS